jgi:hypothetical protein
VDVFERVGHNVFGGEGFDVFVALYGSSYVAIGNYANRLVVVIVDESHAFATIAYGVYYIVEWSVG